MPLLYYFLMEPRDLSSFFHQSSKDPLKGRSPSPHRGHWPAEWDITYYKVYPRFSKVPLTDDSPSADFFNLIKNRKSRRDYSRDGVSSPELSVFLKYACGNIARTDTGRSRRAQPSGGARFPIEIYPVIFRSSNSDRGLPAGLYHYNIKEHVLDVLWNRGFEDADIDRLFTYPWVKDASMAIIMTAVFYRNQMKYGERGYRQILLEAGHIGQNIYLIAEALGLKCCALSGTRDEEIEKLLDIDGVTESLVYAIAIGK